MLRSIVISMLFTICFGYKQGRIVDGNPTEITKHPYQVSLELHGHHCGGSIISPDWVVTAGHCVTEEYSTSLFDPSELQVRVGSNYREEGGSVHPISKIILHPEYKLMFNLPDYDIAVLKVSTPFVYNDAVKPISMATVSPSAGAAAVMTGWGLTRYVTKNTYKYVSHQLQELDVEIVDRQKCKVDLFIVNNNMLCAKGLKLYQAPCSGDSGGPLVFNGKLVGLGSWTPFCGETGLPDVYTDVARFRKWVETVTGVA